VLSPFLSQLTAEYCKFQYPLFRIVVLSVMTALEKVEAKQVSISALSDRCAQRIHSDVSSISNKGFNIRSFGSLCSARL